MRLLGTAPWRDPGACVRRFSERRLYGPARSGKTVPRIAPVAESLSPRPRRTPRGRRAPPAEREADQKNGQRADDVVPQPGDLGEARHGKHGEHREDEPVECARGRRPSHEEREEEDTEKRAVEDRAHFIDGLHQRPELAGIEREHHGEAAPAQGGEPGHEQIVRVRPLRFHMSPVEVDHRRTGQSREFGVERGHGGGEDDGDEKTEDARRNVRDQV